MLFEDIKEGETYWYCHTAMLQEYPKQVTVEKITGRVVRFADYVGQEKFGDLRVICEGLFDTELEANELFVTLMMNDDIHFIEDDGKWRTMKQWHLDNIPHIFL